MSSLSHAIFLRTLRSAAADRVKREYIKKYNERRDRYEYVYHMVTNSMRARRDAYPWIPLRLHDWSFVARFKSSRLL